MAKAEHKNDEFEKLVEAALKVDPKGLSGKHKAKLPSKAKKPKPKEG
jgi:hypothetical protein